MKRYIVDGNVIDTRNVVGFAGERLFVEFDDHAALLRAVAEVIRHKGHDADCPVEECARCRRGKHHGMHGEFSMFPHEFSPLGQCSETCGHDRALALLEVKP